MAAMDPDEILGYIREIGLAPTKAKNLWLAGQPDRRARRRGVPRLGGPRVAARHRPQDRERGHVPGLRCAGIRRRHPRASLAERWGLSNGTTVERTEADLKAVFPIETWNDRHLQIIFFGREYCPARRHDLAACPICSWAATKKRIREESMR